VGGFYAVVLFLAHSGLPFMLKSAVSPTQFSPHRFDQSQQHNAAAMAARQTAEIERLTQELAAAKRQRDGDAHERARLEAELSLVKGNAASLQVSVDSVTAQRNRDSRDRADTARQLEELRADNARLRREVSQALDTKLSHLRAPQVSFDQYRELLALTEQYAAALQLGDSGALAPAASSTTSPEKGGSAMSQARSWVDRMAAVGLPPTAPAHTDPNAHTRSVSNGIPQIQMPVPQTPASSVYGGSHAPSPARTLRPAEEHPQYSARGSQMSARQRHAPSSSADPHGGASAGTTAAAADASTVREEIVDGKRLFRVVRDAHPHEGKLWSFHNNTNDTQFILDFTFGPQSDVVALPNVAVDGATYRISLYPGETKPFVRGLINGYKMAVRYGPPDEKYVIPTSLSDTELGPTVERVRSLHAGSADDLLHMCVAQGLPFVDLDFPPLSASTARPFDGAAPAVVWERAAKLVPVGEQEELCVSGFGDGGPVQGQLQDAWIVSAMAILAARRDSVARAFAASAPSEQLAGMFKVTLNAGGAWRTVRVDGFLPCVPKTAPLQPLGVSCAARRDVWASVMEKAFAKVAGSYAALQGGDALEALHDITGCPFQRFEWGATAGGKAVGGGGKAGAKGDASAFLHLGRATQSHPDNMAVLVSAAPTLSAAGSEPSTPATAATQAANSRRLDTIGFRQGHAYSVLATVQCEDFRLCFVVNPQGAGAWSAEWSPKSEMWDLHPAVARACAAATAGISNIAGGVWMEWRDVAFYFDGAAVLLVRPTWTDIRIPNSFHGTQPEWILELSVTKPTTVFIGLHQKDRRGVDPASPDHSADMTYSAFMLSVVGCSDAGAWDAVAQSHGGSFWRGRDVHLEVQLTPRDRAYYIVPRRYSADGTKHVVVSLMLEHRDAATAALRRPTEELTNAMRYSPVWKFDPAPCPAVAVASCQIDRQDSAALQW
jgi:hypothetical protein